MNKIIFILLLLFWVNSSHSLTFHIQLSSNAAASSPDLVVQESLLSPPPAYSLPILNRFAPVKTSYLVQIKKTDSLIILKFIEPDVQYC